MPRASLHGQTVPRAKVTGDNLSLATLEACPNFEDCEAPLCPLWPKGDWGPGEEVCRQRRAPCFVKVQRRIAKVYGLPTRGRHLQRREGLGLFTRKALEAISSVRRGIKGY
jgi:hypothetical protein